MKETYPLGLALLDFIPNLAFLAGVYYLYNLLILVRLRPASRLMLSGGLLVFFGGLTKASWKLIYTLSAADIAPLREMQFALLAPGFLLMFLSVWSLARSRKGKTAAASTAAMALWKIPLMIVVTIFSLGSMGILTYLSYQRRAPVAGALFSFSALCLLAMSGLSGAAQTVAMQWVAEITNTLGQLGFALASWMLYRDYRCELEQDYLKCQEGIF